MRQLIIARKDLNMSAGKLAAQCCHASIAFLTNKIKSIFPQKVLCGHKLLGYHFDIEFSRDVYKDWICGSFTKTICEAKNKNQLLKAVTIAEELGLEESAKWMRRAEKRRKLMNKYMLAKNSVFYDYSMRTKELGIFTSASVFPLYFGLATEKQAQAFAENVTRIEEEYGVTICEKHEIKGNYQWAYPNAWPCMQHLVVFGLERYGYTDIALRIGKKYVGMVEKIFEETGELWEKYNAVNGTHKSLGNDASIMLGWTAGTYLTIKNFIEEKEKN